MCVFVCIYTYDPKKREEEKKMKLLIERPFLEEAMTWISIALWLVVILFLSQ